MAARTKQPAVHQRQESQNGDGPTVSPRELLELGNNLQELKEAGERKVDGAATDCTTRNSHLEAAKGFLAAADDYGIILDNLNPKCKIFSRLTSERVTALAAAATEFGHAGYGTAVAAATGSLETRVQLLAESVAYYGRAASICEDLEHERWALAVESSYFRGNQDRSLHDLRVLIDVHANAPLRK